jgi:cytochrome c553
MKVDIKDVFSTALMMLMVLSETLYAAGDVEAGKSKSQTCIACHGQNGVSPNPLWPNIAGQKDQYIIEQLKALKSGTRVNPMMSPIAKMLSDQDMENLAAYFSQIKD